MSGPDTSHSELVRRSRWHGSPYLSRTIHYKESRIIRVHDLPSRDSASGKLDLLPVELLHNIFQSLDFQSLRCLRVVNFATKQLVEALPAYADLVKHAPNALRALADTNLLSYFDATQLYDVLLCDRCAGCNEFGDHLFLPACKRCCIDCLLDHPYMRVITVSAAKKRFGQASLIGLPIMHSLPGHYGLEKQLHSERYWLISTHAAHMRSLFLAGDRDEIMPSLKRQLAMYAKTKGTLLERLPPWQALPQMKVTGSLPQSPQAHDDKLNVMNDTIRFMATTPFPSLDRDSRKVEHGVRCLPCTECFWGPDGPGPFAHPHVRRSMDMAFSEEGFSEHIKKCPLARQYWE